MTKIRAQIQKNGKGFGVRLGVKTVGCSGLAYTLDYVDGAKEGDKLFGSGTVNIVVDAASLPMLDGSHIDFVKEGFNDVLKITNPNAESECGCGESFNLKKPDPVV
ncbi:Iron binding protein IscA for iron-sulfur cluster assembly [Oxalobacteraceae bacterium IMCC9480]|nr:Iron binding protein IscA for iron-sulfur cluster assembly [Oxalobacteraceae bacterium IMCC9480]